MDGRERNKAVVLAALEAADAGDLEAVKACFAPDYVDHSLCLGSRNGSDREAGMATLREFAAAFSSLRHTVLDLIAEGDRVVLRVSATGTHQVEVRGIAATGRRVTMTQTVIYRLDDGLIVERWVDGAQSVLDQLADSDAPTPETGVRVIRSESAQRKRDPAGGDYWELRLNGVSLTFFRLDAGASFPSHAHDAEQITLVLEGQLSFEVGQNRFVLGPGDAIGIPSRLSHAVTAGSRPVRAVDAWAPPPAHLGSPPNT